jgi:polyhydroxyalkanoate synthesis regulator phasin
MAGWEEGVEMDVFREALLIGLGAWDYSKERVNQAVDRLRQRGELSKEQADKLLQELRERGQKEEEELGKTVSSAASKARSAFLFATHGDLNKVEERLAKLEAAVQALLTKLGEKKEDA